MDFWGGFDRTVIAPPQPSAGNGATVQLQQSEEGILVSVAFRIVTSAAIAARTPIVQVTDGSGINVLTVVSAATASAGTTADYCLAWGLTAANVTTNTFASGPIAPFPLKAGDSIVLSVDGIDVGDQLSRVRVVMLQRPVRPDTR